MENTKVIDLAAMQDLLAVWDSVRKRIVSGDADSLYTALRGPAGIETIYLGGQYRKNPLIAMNGVLRASAISSRRGAEAPPPFRASRM